VTPPIWATGLGLVTPLGVGVEATWGGLLRGDRGIEPVTLFDVSGHRSQIAGQVEPRAARPASDPHRLDRPEAWSRSAAMAAGAAAEALRMAGLDPRTARVGLVVGGTTGGMFETEELLAQIYVEPDSRHALARLLSHPLTVTADRLKEQLGPFVRARTLASACSSGANALVVAASWLLAGEVDAVVAGGADGLCRLTFAGFNALCALDPEPCRPFDRSRRGTSLGEGAGFLVLERADHARARGAVPVAELAGWALGSEAHHITNPAPDGTVVAELVSRALARAGLGPEDIDYVNAHGTGTTLNDATEAEALRLALGRELGRIPISSCKGQIGHTLGAAGAIEAAVTALAVARGVLPPTGGLREPDEALGLVHVVGTGRRVERVRAAVSNAFGFGGMDSVLVFAQPRDERAPSRRESERPAPELVVTGTGVFADPDPDGHLDAARARRLDRPARIAAVAVQNALADSGARAHEVGLVLGTAFGNVDGSAAFVQRLIARGPRAASPAEFPNLVPSSPVGHVSIYLGLRGPAFATADLEQSGESAFVQGYQLLRAGEGEAIVAGALQLRSDIVERARAVLFGAGTALDRAGATDLAAVVLVETTARARARGARVLARVEQVLEWRDSGERALRELRPPGAGRGEVLVPASGDPAHALIEATAWSRCPRVVACPGLGDGGALGAMSIATAVRRLREGEAAEILVLGGEADRGYAIVLSAP
jgi:3-oxoacyl-[acyl-carrier-protein] synthase II